MYTSKKKGKTSTSCILCALKPQIIPFSTLELVCTWYEESPPPVFLIHRLQPLGISHEHGWLVFTWEGFDVEVNVFTFAGSLPLVLKAQMAQSNFVEGRTLDFS